VDPCPRLAKKTTEGSLSRKVQIASFYDFDHCRAMIAASVSLGIGIRKIVAIRAGSVSVISVRGGKDGR
jgi:hypothetical protein